MAHFIPCWRRNVPSLPEADLWPDLPAILWVIFLNQLEPKVKWLCRMKISENAVLGQNDGWKEKPLSMLWPILHRRTLGSGQERWCGEGHTESGWLLTCSPELRSHAHLPGPGGICARCLCGETQPLRAFRESLHVPYLLTDPVPGNQRELGVGLAWQ